MSKHQLKQLIENAINELLTELEDEDESGLVPPEKGDSHQTQGSDPRFWGNRGAGILLIAKDTGRLLLVHRSKYVNEPGTWGIPGGKIDDSESPIQAAKREAHEELGYSGTIDTIPAHVFKAGEFRFHNFVAIVPTEFNPTLDWENDAAEWFDIDHLPSPLHFGVQSLLTNSKDVISGLLHPQD